MVSVFKAGRVKDRVGPDMFFLLLENQELWQKLHSRVSRMCLY